MSYGYLTSDKLCRVITKNFLADYELEQRLARIERKRRRVSMQLSESRRKVEQELFAISPTTPTRAPSSESSDRGRWGGGKVFVLEASSIPEERQKQNALSYRRIVQKLNQAKTLDVRVDKHCTNSNQKRVTPQKPLRRFPSTISKSCSTAGSVSGLSPEVQVKPRIRWKLPSRDTVRTNELTRTHKPSSTFPSTSPTQHGIVFPPVTSAQPSDL